MRPVKPLSLPEFIALVAMLTGTVAFSIDGILPGLPAMAAEFGAADTNDLHLVILGFVMGMGAGTFVMGPLSDTFGRKTVMLSGAALYSAMAALATVMPTLEGVIAARVMQGVGAAAPRVVAMALVRDLYSGRNMARVLSLMMIAFTIIPALAPMMGGAIIALTGWRGVFWAFTLFSLLTGLWLAFRQPETLPREKRMPFKGKALWRAVRSVLGSATVRRAVAAQMLIFGTLLCVLISVQPIFDIGFGRGESFVYWFGFIAVLAAGASLLNATLVGRFGMLLLMRSALAGHLVLSGGALMVWTFGQASWDFPTLIVYLVGCFSLIGLTMGNLNALAMLPLGHVAGTAASTITAFATVGGTVIAAIAGLWFTGTPEPLAYAALLFAGLAFVLTLGLREG